MSMVSTYTLVEVDGVFARHNVGDGRALGGLLGLLFLRLGRHRDCGGGRHISD